jgi:hypothetical protein
MNPCPAGPAGREGGDAQDPRGVAMPDTRARVPDTAKITVVESCAHQRYSW